jgi:two-component system, OmpR family, response regulator MtrA
MPGMSGLEAIQIIRSDPEIAATPIVVVTANLVGTDLQDAINEGIDAWLTKPFSPNQLKGIVEKHIAR